MEGFGVLRAAAAAGVPALELRAVSNAYGAPRADWRIDEAIAALAGAVSSPARGASMRDLPPPLPPGERTIGQLVAEAIRFYGNQFWKVLPLGIPLAVVDQLCATQPLLVQIADLLAATPLFVLAYVRACSLVVRRPDQPDGVARRLAI